MIPEPLALMLSHLLARVLFQPVGQLCTPLPVLTKPVPPTSPHSMQLDLVATFGPQTEKAVNYNVVCRVRNKPTPLTLNVKGEGYALRHALMLEMADGALTELAPRGDNTIDFGQV